jgi:hypothetical protein
MTSTIPDSDAFNWIIGPAGRCVKLIADEVETAGFLLRAVTVASGFAPYLHLARKSIVAHKDQSDVARIDRLIAEQHKISSQAQEVIDADFHRINVHGIIGLWVAIEVAVEDTVVLILTKALPAAQSALSALKRPPKIDDAGISEAEARRLYDRLQRQYREGQSVSEGYRLLLQALNISVEVPSESAKILSELNYVRNCLLHRGGIIDKRAMAEAQKLQLFPGDSLRLGNKMYGRYLDAATTFSHALLMGVLRSPYVRIRQDEQEQRE